MYRLHFFTNYSPTIWPCSFDSFVSANLLNFANSTAVIVTYFSAQQNCDIKSFAALVLSKQVGI